ncbi:hypothetical protein O3M35_009538 [Rhynocoris fuscipes]|uniref:Uncharacterized protein n=1 Tax=Rhynocoris fuscipes TaxID=488301 RepID=A0AAW1D978_9HEMI
MTELQAKICFMPQVKWHPCLTDVAQNLIRSMLSNVSMKYKKFLCWIKLFLRYGGHKIRNFEMFCWQHC